MENYRSHTRAYCPAGDPARCQGINKKGEQCVYRALDGQKYCSSHMPRSLTALEKRQYNVDKWKASISEKVNTGAIYNLREDIGIVRVIMETTLNRCNDEDELLMRAPAILDITSRLERLVNSSVKLEERLRNLLDVQQVAMFAEAVINAVNKALEELDITEAERTEALDSIATALENALPKC